MTSDTDLDLLALLQRIDRTLTAIAQALNVDQREHDRSSVTGRYVSAEDAAADPATTVHEGG